MHPLLTGAVEPPCVWVCVLTDMCTSACACTFDPLGGAVCAELLSESGVVQLQLLQTLGQTQDRGPQGLLLPLRAPQLRSTATETQQSLQ